MCQTPTTSTSRILSYHPKANKTKETSAQAVAGEVTKNEDPSEDLPNNDENEDPNNNEDEDEDEEDTTPLEPGQSSPAPLRER